MSTARVTSAAAILGHFRERVDELVEELSTLIRYDTPTGDVERVRAFVEHYRDALRAVGVTCEEIHGEKGPHLFGEIPGDDPPVVLVGHSDTVWPAGEVGRRPPSRIDGRLHGPGAYDMRAGLALIAWSLRYLHEHGLETSRRIVVCIAADEEEGSDTAREQLYNRLPDDATALVPEPPCPDGSLKIARKGVGIFGLEVRGREVHAGVEPEKGISAIAEVARLALEVESWGGGADGLLVNVGTIAGGTATNVVPGRAECGIDLRYDRLVDGERFESRLRALRPVHPEAEITITGGLVFPPLEPTAASRALADRAIELAAEVGLDISAGRSGGGSDGSLLAARGLTVLDGIGVDGAGAHALEEHVIIDRLPARAALFTRVLLELAGA